MTFKKEEGPARNAGNTLQTLSVAALDDFETKPENTSTQEIIPPANTIHVSRWDDLPDEIKPATYRVIDTGHTFTVQKKTRQTLEGLIRQPVACASKCRVSDRVLLLRRDCGLNIEMEMFKGDGHSQGESYGVYFLKSKVERIGDSSAE